MNIPNIPSDNIYKFVALSSLATIIIVSIYISSEIGKVSEKRNDVKIEIEKYGKDISVLELDVKYLFRGLEKQLKKFVNPEKSKLIDTSLYKVDRLNYLISLADSLDDNQKDMVEPILNNFQEEKLKCRKILEEINLKEKLVKINQEKISNYVSDLRILTIIYLILFPMLLITTIIGFRNWYTKVQKYQDIILKNQAERFISEIK